MKTYEDTIDAVAGTLTQVSMGGPFGFYLTDQQIAWIYGKDCEVVEMDRLMAKDIALKRLTDSFI